jgi:hypothetical protein
MSNTNSRVANKLCPVAVNHLGISRLWHIGIVVGERDTEDVGPFFQFLAEVGVVKCGVDSSVPAMTKGMSEKSV